MFTLIKALLFFYLFDLITQGDIVPLPLEMKNRKKTNFRIGQSISIFPHLSNPKAC